MKIALAEIWNFLDLVDTSKDGWSFALQAGVVTIPDISTEDMMAVRKDPRYDTELLPSLFTFREILWQPDVFTEASMSLPALRILKAFCGEYVETHAETDNPAMKVYIPLLKGMSKCVSAAIKQLSKERADTKKVLGALRIHVFPIIKFFIYHPKNRKDYLLDATNRLNYAVKIMLTEFYGNYTALNDPFWVVDFNKSKAENSTVSAEQ
ncbi:MAG: hypothetical protein AAF789_07560 [Bacteroidota bacterium]